MRSDLMAELRLWLRDEGLAEAGAAERLGTSLDKATDLVQGKWRSFGTDDLLALAAKAGMRVRLEFRAGGGDGPVLGLVTGTNRGEAESDAPGRARATGSRVRQTAARWAPWSSAPAATWFWSGWRAPTPGRPWTAFPASSGASPAASKTLTYDQGKEMARHEELARRVHTSRSTSPTRTAPGNGRPRKVLGFQAPAEE